MMKLLAQTAKKNGVEQFHLVSSTGANKSSSFFYTKLKGETEADITKVAVPGLYIYRQSFLTGNRQELRSAEKFLVPLMKLINPLLIGGWKKYRSIPGATVAMAMYKQSIKNATGVFVYESDKIKQLS
jgi:uncharacterized protein YbjT (DUF2867 family)